MSVLGFSMKNIEWAHYLSIEKNKSDYKSELSPLNLIKKYNTIVYAITAGERVRVSRNPLMVWSEIFLGIWGAFHLL